MVSPCGPMIEGTVLCLALSCLTLLKRLWFLFLLIIFFVFNLLSQIFNFLAIYYIFHCLNWLFIHTIRLSIFWDYLSSWLMHISFSHRLFYLERESYSMSPCPDSYHFFSYGIDDCFECFITLPFSISLSNGENLPPRVTSNVVDTSLLLSSLSNIVPFWSFFFHSGLTSPIDINQM